MSALVVASVLFATAWAPFDGIAGLFGTPKLHDPTAIGKHDRPLDEVEHIACHQTARGCTPSGGCDDKCHPRVGHYWEAPDATGASSGSASSWLLPLWFSSFLPPIAPTYFMMTSRGVMVIEPNFVTTDYRMLGDERATIEKSFPGLSIGLWLAKYVVLPGVLLFTIMLMLAQ